MALSQKFFGRILTPWFDSAEWKATKEMIYSDSIESKQAAIERMNIWKLRTPLLSVGIEGTLIILEALNGKHKNLNDFELSHIFSTALLRFLNICAANNIKQGTFYKTAEENDLPLWLITLRHDIAHDHKIPSKRILELALNECLKWIKEKYWDVQQKYLKDYVISEPSKFKEIFTQYAKLKLYIFYQEDTTEIENNLRKLFPTNDKLQLCDFMKLVENYICENVLNRSIKNSCEDIVSILVRKKMILETNYITIQGAKRIPDSFFELWAKTIYLLNETETIYLLIDKLDDVTHSPIYERHEKEIAALWILKLFKDELSRDYSEKFSKKMLKKPNIYTLTYMEAVLKFNSISPDSIRNKCREIRDLVQPTKFYEDKPIHSMKDLEELSKCNLENNQQNIEAPSNKFRKLSNSEKIKFKGYPFGIIPDND